MNVKLYILCNIVCDLNYDIVFLMSLFFLSYDIICAFVLYAGCWKEA